MNECDFCDKNNEIYGTWLASNNLPIGESCLNAYMYIKGERFLRTTITDADSEVVWQLGTQIKYCPMCGRKLRNE